MNRFEKIAKALSICLPETMEEGEQECVECPYFDDCSSGTIGLPLALVMEIKRYFSKNWDEPTLIQ